MKKPDDWNIIYERFFVSIVDENSFTEAAEKNFVSQSAVSQAMSALEADLGVKLIERKNRSFLPAIAVGKLPEVSGAIKRVPLYRKNRRVTRKYCLFWLKERTGYYIEEFARMLQARLK